MATVKVQQNVGGYSGTMDTYIRGGRPNTQYNTAVSVLSDGSDSAGLEIQGLLSFANLFGSGPGQIPLGSTITSATLTITLSDGTNNPIRFYRMNENWTAYPTMTWNAFGNGIQTNGVEAMATADATVASSLRGNLAINVMSSLQAWSNGASNFGWMISSGGADGFVFSSSEGAFAPVLTVNFEAPTAPTKALSVVETLGTTHVAEGGVSDAILIALTAAPTSTVTITISTSGPGDISVPVSVLTFTTANWATQQTVLLNAINDSLVEGSERHTITVTASSLDSGYAGLTSGVGITVADNDVALPTALSPFVVAVRNTSLYTAGDPSAVPGSGDPSGIAWVPGLDVLFIVDSEHDESPYFSPRNLFMTQRDGTFLGSASMTAFTFEPTGICYNLNNGYLYVTDDDTGRIYLVDPNNPTAAVGSIYVRPWGLNDIEDPVYNTQNGNIYFLDGDQRKLIEMTETGQLVDIVTMALPINGPEAMAYDPTHNVFYMAGGATRGVIYQVDTNGNVLGSFNILNTYLNNGIKPRIKGLEIAPSSNPNDGGRLSLYAVDYGLDQILDGRWFEIDLYHDWPIV